MEKSTYEVRWLGDINAPNTHHQGGVSPDLPSIPYRVFVALSHRVNSDFKPHTLQTSRGRCSLFDFAGNFCAASCWCLFFQSF